MRVTHFHRAKCKGISIERLFKHIRSAVSYKIEIKVCYLPFGGTNPFCLLFNIIWAAFHQGEINHITGDCHYIALGLSRKNTILTIHDCVNLHKLKGLKRKIHKLLWYYLPCKCAKVITVISDFSRQELINELPWTSDKVQVIHNCVDPEFSKKPFQNKPGKPVILQIGTKQNKNLDMVANALNGLECHLRIIGPLNETQLTMLKEYKIDYSNTSNISDKQLQIEFEKSDILLFVSTYEGFGLPIIEAQAIGRPVITSNLEPMVEIAGDGACIVDPSNADSIRKGLLLIINDLTYKNKITNSGIQNVKRFQTNKITAHYTALYRKILKIS